jgi:hypothetical protein
VGVDYMRLKAKPFLKGLDQGRVEIARRNLFTRDPAKPDHAIVAHYTRPGSLTEGSEVLVRAEGEGLVLVDDLTIRAVVVRPPPSIVDAIRQIGGYARGRILKMHPTLQLLEVAIV